MEKQLFNLGERIRIFLSGEVQGYLAEIEVTNIYILSACLKSDSDKHYIQYGVTNDPPAPYHYGCEKVWYFNQHTLLGWNPEKRVPIENKPEDLPPLNIG